ncbi:MAG: protein-L-isoaspartate O-methyltransferase family protein [Gaiellaceae bacterium]
MASPSSAMLRSRLVQRLERDGCITSDAVRQAFLAVPRELFLSVYAAENGLGAVYRDEAILTRKGPAGEPLSSSSQPAVMALMLERLDLFPGARVLEVGAGTGYNAALLATIVGRGGTVVSMELDAATAAEARTALAAGGYDVQVEVGDGREGWPPQAPFDRIVVTASCRRVPRIWHEQLGDRGLLQLPLWIRGPELQLVTTLRRDEGGFRSVSALVGAFMPIRGRGRSALAPGPAETGNAQLLRGAALARLTEVERGRLQALPLVPPRIRRIDPEAIWPLWFFLRIMIPARYLVLSGASVGVVGPGGRSLALLDRGDRTELPGRRRSAAAIRSYGTEEAETLLLDLIERWRARGGPSDRDLAVDIRFDGDVSRVRCRWSRRDD